MTRQGESGYLRFDLTQHQYIGGQDDNQSGYMELIEIADPLPGRPAVMVVFWGTGRRREWWEFASVEEASEVWKQSLFWQPGKIINLPGCIRQVKARTETELPWFYAEKGAPIIDDFVAGTQSLITGG